MTTPSKGFYYHYKHDANGSVNNYAYEIIDVGTHTETKEKFVIYRSLYATETQGDSNYWLRPFEMFMENVEVNGVQMPRFRPIADPAITAQLEEIKRQMYSYSD